MSPTRAPLTPMPVFSGLSQPTTLVHPGQIDPSWEMINRPIHTAGQLTMQTAQSVFHQPVTPPFGMGPAPSTPTPPGQPRANPSTRVLPASNVPRSLSTMYSGNPSMAPPVPGMQSHIPQEEYLPEFSVGAVETDEIVLPSNVKSLHHWGFALVGFGKHKGSRYREIYHGDPSYIRWICSRSKNASPAQLDFIKFSRAMNAQTIPPHQPASDSVVLKTRQTAMAPRRLSQSMIMLGF